MRRGYEEAVDVLDAVCASLGPQVSLVFLARCTLIVNQLAFLPDTIVAMINYHLLPSASSALFYADRLLKTAVDGASLMCVLRAADAATEMVSSRRRPMLSRTHVTRVA